MLLVLFLCVFVCLCFYLCVSVIFVYVSVFVSVSVSVSVKSFTDTCTSQMHEITLQSFSLIFTQMYNFSVAVDKNSNSGHSIYIRKHHARKRSTLSVFLCLPPTPMPVIPAIATIPIYKTSTLMCEIITHRTPLAVAKQFTATNNTDIIHGRVLLLPVAN